MEILQIIFQVILILATFLCSLVAGLLFTFVSHQVLAADALLRVFLDDAPLSGVSVTLNGVPVGTTNERGGVAANLGSGDHVLVLSDDDLEYPISFSSTDNP